MDPIIKNKNSYIFLIFLLFFELLFSRQELGSDATIYDSRASLQKYTKNIDGSIMISLNIWGSVRSPGRHTVPDGADLITILSIVGGPVDGANLSKVKVIRDSKHSNEIVVINLTKFIKSGDKSNLIDIIPNDTIIIPETLFSFFYKRLNNITNILSLFSIYIAITNNS